MNDENTKLLITNAPQIITALGAIVASILGFVILWRQGKIAKDSTVERKEGIEASTKLAKSIENRVGGVETKVDKVHEMVNGQTEKLIKVEKAVSHKEGHDEGVQEQKVKDNA